MVYECERCYHLNVEIAKKLSGRNTEIDLIISLCICVCGRIGATIVCDRRAVAENEQIVQWVILFKQLCGLLKRVG